MIRTLDVQEVSLAFGATADESQPEDVAKDHKTEVRQSAPLPESVQMVETSSLPPKPLQTESAVPVKANATLAQMAAEFLSSGLAGQATKGVAVVFFPPSFVLSMVPFVETRTMTGSIFSMVLA